jgi:FkbH-like protein
MEIAPQAAMMYGELTARLIAAARGKYKKCLVLDLDNTLWGGVVGDDGIEGIVLGAGSAPGEAFLALQAYALTLSKRGVLLAVCSKNDPKIAEAAFRDHPEILLKRDDFAAFMANWNDKAENLVAIAKALNIGVDSLVFVDDNPVERARIREALPMVAVPELPADPAGYVRCLARAGYFEATAFTKEDQERSRQYAANAARDSLASATGEIDVFLQGLEMSVEYGPIAPNNLVRVTQLINKTNQFNTTTIRRTEHEIDALMAGPNAIGLQFRLIDKFGDNGIVSVIILTPQKDRGDALEIVTWVMSCRVFGRQLEDEIMNIVVEAARRRGVQTLCGPFVPTKKNGVIRDLFANLGFTRLGSADVEDAPALWEMSVADYARRPTRIARKEHQE